MRKVTIYTVSGCPYCARAKKILDDQKVVYTEILTDFDSPLMAELTAKTSSDTLPQIFMDDVFLGGSDDLAEAVRSGRFSSLLRSSQPEL